MYTKAPISPPGAQSIHGEEEKAGNDAITQPTAVADPPCAYHADMKSAYRGQR